MPEARAVPEARPVPEDGTVAEDGSFSELPSENRSSRTAFNSDLCTLMRPLYSIKPSLRNRFMKKLTRERVVPIISARVSCVMGGMKGSGSPG